MPICEVEMLHVLCETECLLNLHSSGRRHGLTGTSLAGCWCRTTAVVLGGRTSKPTCRWL
jgi:hypothetical protein